MNFFKSAISISSQVVNPKYLFKDSLRRCGKLRGDCDKAISCWNCKEAVDCTKYFFCNKCDHIQPTSEQNLFEYMGFKPIYELDDEALKRRFRDLQFKLHPDKFARSSEVEKNMSDEHSRKLNRAFKTLSEPLARARYLLQVLGEEETTADLSPEDLMKMMEWNEKVAEMSKQDLERERIVVQNSILHCLSELQKAFSKRLLSEVKQQVTSLSYLYSLRKTIDDKLEKSHSS